ncbi:MAG: acetolactate synthase small subunit [Lachnospiraceae bacterium]|jgi:acetolactate synthase-1/3 small subunit|nr:acetolactate synthase small subunit [Lachnospiraceae bacterium]
MKKRWISLLVENDVGVLARISGLFSAKSYNLNSLTVGPAEDETMSRMTISLISDDAIFEQVKKQLNRCVEVIKVVDYTEAATVRKEFMFVKVRQCSDTDIRMLFQVAKSFQAAIVDGSSDTLLIECAQTEERNTHLICKLRESFAGRIEVVRGGSVAIEAISVPH